MAPSVPDEIDLFTAPHSRMKELVDIYTRKVQCVDYRDGPELVSLLQDLDTTLREFKSHESIENIFIMDQLKNRLKQRQISNTAVCDCHKDNQLSDVVRLVRTGTQVRERSIGERVTFGLQLQQAFQDFVNTFLPHMEEEEQVFQPLLVEHFEYDELKVLREVVLKEHELIKEQQRMEKAQELEEGEPETHDSVKDLRDLDWDLCTLAEPPDGPRDGELDPVLPHPPDCWDIEQIRPEYQELPGPLNYQPHDQSFYQADYIDYHHQSDYQDYHHHQIPDSTITTITTTTTTPPLPAEVLVEIFRHLAPPELCRCAQVCSSWNSAVFSPALWPALYPVQWARGIWESRDVGLGEALEDEAQRGGGKWDEDADVDEAEEEQDPLAKREHWVLENLVWWVLPRVGVGVSTLVVDAGRGITSRLLQQALALCPALTTLSAAHTLIDSYAFKGLWLHGGLRKLQHLDLQGCQMVDDVALQHLALCVCQGEASTLPPCLEEEWVYQGNYCRCAYLGLTWSAAPCRTGGGRPTLHTGKNSYPSGLLPGTHTDIEEICSPRGSWEVTARNIQCRSPSLPAGQPTPSSLAVLSLSGCWRVRDEGLLAIGVAGGLLGLTLLDVSGCYQLSGQALEALARLCPALPPQNLWYCDDIMDGPFPSMANGCANLANPVRACCRSGR